MLPRAVSYREEFLGYPKTENSVGQSRDMPIAKLFLLDLLRTIRDTSRSEEFEMEVTTFRMFLLSIKNVKELTV